MSTIRTAIQVNDGMSPAFRSMNNAMNIVLNSFESLQIASHNSIDTASIQLARQELAKAQTTINSAEQELLKADQAQQKLNKDMKDGGPASDGLLDKIKQIAIAAGAVFGVQKVIGLSDEMISATARIKLMNDGLKTTEQVQKDIFASAQRSRTAYQDTVAVVSKLGILASDSFSGTNEIIAFTELMNKSFKISGASTSESTNAMYQLTQAMAAGKLQGDEFRSIMENAPLLAESIAKYTGKTKGDLKEMSSDGLITADIIKNAMFSAADETNAKFAQLPLTYSQVWTNLKNQAMQLFLPLIQTIGAGAQYISDNWSTLAPIFLGLAVAVGLYATMMGIQAAVTWLAVEANRALVISMLTNPLLWIALAIGVLIGIIYKWIQSVGGIHVAWLITCNALMTAWDWVKIGFWTGINWIIDKFEMWKLSFVAVSVGIQNIFGDLKSGSLKILQDMINGAIGYINDFISLLNKIPGINIQAVGSVTFGTEAQVQNEAEKQARNASLNKQLQDVRAGITERENSLWWMKKDARDETAKRYSNIKIAQDAALAAKAADSDNLAVTASNTGKIADDMELTEEDLKYLRDLAEMEVINRFTTAEIKVDVAASFGDVHETADIDGILTAIETKTYESMQIAAEGV